MKKRKILSFLLAGALVVTSAFSNAGQVKAESVAWESDVDVSWIDPDKPMVALSYDDGPVGTAEDATSQQILDVLEEYNAHATFFYIGQNITDDNEDEIKRAQSLGCEIGNHTQTHTDLSTLTREGIQAEISQTADKLTEITGQTNFLVRPPYLTVNQLIADTVKSPLILDRVDTQDWSGISSEQIISNVLDNVCDGAIVLMHETMPNTAEAAKTIIPSLLEKGYQLVTISEMMKAKGITMSSGSAYMSTEWVWSYQPLETTSPSPLESVEPSPSESIEPTPSESVEPSPSESIAPTPSESVEPSPSESIVATASQSGNSDLYTGAFSVSSQWDTAYNVEFTVTNNSDKAISNWNVQFTLNDEISSIWCATINSAENNVYSISNAAWNGTIEPHSSVSFGFTATKGSSTVVIPTDIVVTAN